MITLQEFLKTVDGYEEIAYSSAFIPSDSQDSNEKFQACLRVAEELSKIEEYDIPKLADIFEIVPAEYYNIITMLAKRQDDRFNNCIKSLDRALAGRYYHRFKKYVEADKTNKLVSMTKSDIAKYDALESRIFDLAERYMIGEFMGLKPLDIVMRYEGKNKLRVALYDIYKMYDRNYNKSKEVLNRNFYKIMDTVLLDLKVYNKNDEVNID